MKKAFIIVCLSAVIVLSFSFVSLKIMARGSDGNYFNTHWRYWFARVPVWRQILGLHYDGDGQADYLGGRYKNIVIEVDTMDGLEIDDETLRQVTASIQGVTKKPTSFISSDNKVAYFPAINYQQLQQTVKQNRQYKNTKKTANIYLLLAGKKDGEPKLLGSTYQEYGIVIYIDALKNFAKDSPQTFNLYVLGTILHEFGHQIGLPHNSQQGCLMNEHAEAEHTAKSNPAEVVTDFCEYEVGSL